MSEADFDNSDESGPFCTHWGDPSDCDEVCVCGHECCRHSAWGTGCNADGCDCDKFTDTVEDDA